jgi:hypothetical protein
MVDERYAERAGSRRDVAAVSPCRSDHTDGGLKRKGEATGSGLRAGNGAIAARNHQGVERKSRNSARGGH